MANASNRLFKLMQKSGTDTVSEVLSLTVKSTNPLQLFDGDKIILTKEFLVFSEHIDVDKITVGDKFLAITYNNGQIYYISDIISSAVEINKYMEEIIDLKSRVSSLESRMTTAENDIDSLDSRVSALERRFWLEGIFKWL